MSEQSCRSCGCTDTRACPEGCFWVKPGLCSACFETQLKPVVDAALAWGGQYKASAPFKTTLCDRRALIALRDDGLIVTDHLGLTAFELTAEGVFVAPQYDLADIALLFERKSARAA